MVQQQIGKLIDPSVVHGSRGVEDMETDAGNSHGRMRPTMIGCWRLANNIARQSSAL
jgi:hypothetical protein